MKKNKLLSMAIISAPLLSIPFIAAACQNNQSKPKTKQGGESQPEVGSNDKKTTQTDDKKGQKTGTGTEGSKTDEKTSDDQGKKDSMQSDAPDKQKEIAMKLEEERLKKENDPENNLQLKIAQELAEREKYKKQHADRNKKIKEAIEKHRKQEEAEKARIEEQKRKDEEALDKHNKEVEETKAKKAQKAM